MADKNNPPTIWEALKQKNPETAMRWLKWHPSQLDRCLEARDRDLPPPLDADERAELLDFHQRCTDCEATLNAIARLGSPKARVVIAGQQPGILGGPLYSVFKALGAIRLARDLARRRPDLDFVPVFWSASDDDDFDEVRRVFWPGVEGELEEILFQHPDWTPGRMIGPLSCRPLADELIERIEASTTVTEFRKGIIERIRQIHAEAPNWESAFADLFLHLFHGMGLVMFTPLMPWVKRRMAPILAAEAHNAGASADKAIRRGREMETAGLEAPLHRRPGAVNFFWIDEAGRRRPLRRVGDRVQAMPPANSGSREGSESGAPGNAHSAPEWSLEELAARVEREPQSFSSNVVLRPVVQDAVFPTVAHVVGPGEAAYLPQVEAVYEDFGVFRPVRYPRPQILLVQKNVRRLLDKYRLTLGQVLGQSASALTRLVVEREQSGGLLQDIRRLHREQRAQLERLGEKFQSGSATASAVDKLMQAMDKGYDKIQERLLYSMEQDERHLGKAMARMENNLNPAGQSQERVLNPIVPFAISYGPDWVRRLAETVDIDPAAGPQTVFMEEL
jgi:bacillithiol biosynthesis cysteine-adding enzyme BshC